MWPLPIDEEYSITVAVSSFERMMQATRRSTGNSRFLDSLGVPAPGSGSSDSGRKALPTRGNRDANPTQLLTGN